MTPIRRQNPQIFQGRGTRWLLAVFLFAVTVGCGLDFTKKQEAACLESFQSEGSGDELGVMSSGLAGGGLAQSFQLAKAASVSRISVKLKLLGSPNGTLTVSLHGSSGGSPLNSDLGAGDIAIADIDEEGWYHVQLSASAALEEETVYWIKLSTDYAANNTDLVQWLGNDGDAYSDGQAKYHDGGTTWSNALTPTHDLTFGINCSNLN